MYLQQRLDGIPGSLAFAADGFHAVVLGFSRQLVGDPRFGSRGFRYCGSILGGAGVPLFPHQNELLANAAEVAQTLTREFRLVGLNGVDFIAREGRPFVTEVNPRYSASMELIERSQAVSLFEIHRQACHGVLPDALQPVKTLYGKAVVFARKDLRIAHDLSRTQTGAVADVPHPGERIQRGRPICTVFSIATGLETCRRLLWRRAAAVYRVTEPRPRQAA